MNKQPNSKEKNTTLAMRPKEAAKALGISPRKLWEITADKTSGIPHTKLGRCVVYPVKALDRWVNDRATCGQSEANE